LSEALSWSERDGIAFLPAPDPLWRRCRTPLTARYAVFGVPLTVQTNAPLLAELAEAAFGHWGDPPDGAAEPDLCLRLIVHDAPEAPTNDRPAPLMRAQEGYFWISAGTSFGFADRRAGFATAYVTPTALAEPERVTACFIECLGVFLACGRRPGTLHAAGIRIGDRGVLLTGRDGAGKSTLAYACVRAGLHLLAEDMVVVEPGPRGAVAWGDARFLHLLPDAPGLFPELSTAPYVRQLNGETKLRVHVHALRPDAAITQMPVWGVCSLGRADGGATRIGPSDPDTIRHALTHFKGDPPIDLSAMNGGVDALLNGHTAHLEVGSDLDGAVRMLQEWVRSLP
jgi:hypothetical protein